MDTNLATGRLLWENKEPESSRLHQFRERVNQKYSVELSDYNSLYQWSVNNIAAFWEEVWHFTGVKTSMPFCKVVDESAPMFPRPSFFEGAKLNFAENLLYPSCGVNERSVAIEEVSETTRTTVSWRELRKRVRHCAAAMRVAGVKKDDRVAGYVANHANAVVAMLAATSIGALWTGISPDTGVYAVLERLRQIEPVMLFADSATIYNGKTHVLEDKIAEIAGELSSLRATVVFSTVPSHKLETGKLHDLSSPVYGFEAFCSQAKPDAPLEFAQLDPDHPVYILYSSGTTGKPKCIVHGAIGTLIQHKKEHDLHCNIRPGDKLFYFTTCTWMMWHWLVSSLAVGATIVLYDGSPFRPFHEGDDGNLAMPQLIQDLGVTHFGTSAKYLSVLEQRNVLPKEKMALSTLRAIYSTGSPLSPSTFEYVYQAFGSDLNLGSITGGTDIISLFGAPSLLSPVYAGEVQVRGLGMAVQAWDYKGDNVTEKGEPGDLVCTKAFPCQPVMFWGEDGKERYQKSYFDQFAAVWHHGDFIQINPWTGGLIMLGRSDGVLKPAGVRFGSAEIYNVLLKHFPDAVSDALCIGRRRADDQDETVVLFLRMNDQKECSPELIKDIQQRIRSELSPRHVPAIIDSCPDIPVTTNGKKVEVAVKQILSGLNIKVSASVANSECLDWYREWAEEHP